MDEKTSNLPQYLTPKQVAELLQVGERTVRLWLRRGVLRGVRFGRLWRVPKEEAEISGRSAAR